MTEVHQVLSKNSEHFLSFFLPGDVKQVPVKHLKGPIHVFWAIFDLVGHCLGTPTPNCAVHVNCSEGWGGGAGVLGILKRNQPVPVDVAFVLDRSFQQEALYNMKHFSWIYCLFFLKA